MFLFSKNMQNDLDFSILIPNTFTEKQLKLHLLKGEKRYPQYIENRVELEWEKAEKKNIFNGNVYSLIKYELIEDELHYWLQKTDYKHFWATNLQLSNSLKSTDLASILAVCAVIETSDSKIIIGKRSSKLAESKSVWHVIGGSIDQISKSETAFNAIRKEMREEIGLESDDIEKVECIGLGRNNKISKPEFLFYVICNITSEKLKSKMSIAIDIDEHTEYRFIEKNNIENFVQNYPFAVIGKAAIKQYFCKKCKEM